MFIEKNINLGLYLHNSNLQFSVNIFLFLYTRLESHNCGVVIHENNNNNIYLPSWTFLFKVGNISLCSHTITTFVPCPSSWCWCSCCWSRWQSVVRQQASLSPTRVYYLYNSKHLTANNKEITDFPSVPPHNCTSDKYKIFFAPFSLLDVHCVLL